MTSEHLAIDQVQVGNRFRKEAGDVESLSKSIAEVGLLHPIVVDNGGRLIAGWRRLEACKKLGWDTVPVNRIPLKELSKGEFHENFVRKDFTVSEMVAIKRNLEPELAGRAGRPEKGADSAPLREKTRDIVAKYAGVSHDTLMKAEAIVDAAEKDPERFGGMLKSVDDGSTSIAYGYGMVTRAEHVRNTPPLPEGEYDVVYADPPWYYHIPLRGSPELHYPTLKQEQIIALKPPASENAVLFLWSPASEIKEALEVLDAWGFSYRSQLVWVKQKIGVGYYFRYQHELLLVGIKGDMPPPLEHDRPSSVLHADTREHSRKSDEAYDLIERMYPKRHYLEMFARTARDGWTAWGNQLWQ